VAGNVYVARSIDCEAEGLIVAAASEIRRPLEVEASGFNFDHDRIAGYAAAMKCFLEHRAADGKVGGETVADEENIAVDILRDLGGDVVVVTRRRRLRRSIR